jgi:hypothetical protein
MLISKKENKLKKNTTISAKTKILKVELKKKKHIDTLDVQMTSRRWMFIQVSQLTKCPL